MLKRIRIKGKSYWQQRDEKGRIIATIRDKGQSKIILFEKEKKYGTIAKDKQRIRISKRTYEVSSKTRPKKRLYSVIAHIRLKGKNFYASSFQDERAFSEKKKEALENLIWQITDYDRDEFEDARALYASKVDYRSRFYVSYKN